ncbi:MAG TPA: dolichyl-phosphate beta-glucosyltransferase [Acidimicrobiales bacterium]|nr:dolichyl-phosphate beta-glucosyltransferase [Acidimicrobiales bacterium]
MTRPALSVVVPAFEEEGRIAAAVERLQEELLVPGGVEIVVVDDGSGDATADVARRAGADQVLTLRVNRGKGAAVRAGMLAARGQALAFTDADLAYSPAQLLRLLHEVDAGFDVVIGSRRHVETTTLVRARRLREVSGRLFNLLSRVAVLPSYVDTQCGLKAFHADAAQVLFRRARVDGFAFDVELIYLTRRYGLSLREVPVELANPQTSSVRLLRDGPLMIKDLLRVRRWGGTGVYDLGPEERATLDRRGQGSSR